MKAILIIDIPDDYDEYGSGDWYVVSDNDDLKIVYEEDGSLMHYKYIEDDIAELKPMPSKKGKYGELNHYDTDIHYEIGWNDCINEILGESE